MGDLPAAAEFVDAGGKITGTLTGPQGPINIAGTFDGNVLKLEFTAQTPNGDIPIKMTATSAAIEIAGKGGLRRNGSWGMVREARQTVTLGITGAIVAMALVASTQRPGGQGRTAPQSQLNRAADAVLKLKSAQFTITREGTPAFLDEKTGVTFTTAQCLYAAPDRVSCDVKITSKTGTVLQLTRVWVPEGTFQSNPLTRQFVKVPPDAGVQRRSSCSPRPAFPRFSRTASRNRSWLATKRYARRTRCI
jgi:hypothetical protein